MKHLPLIFLCIVLSVSCKKDKRADRTSKYPGEFISDIIVTYYPNSNQTSIIVGFHLGYSQFNMQHLQLSKDSYLKINNVEIETKMEKYQNYYELILDGKQLANIEFKDYDGIIYSNTIAPPDTAYFINFPDTVVFGQNFEIQINAPDLTKNESSVIEIDGGGDTGLTIYVGTDTIITVDNSYYFNQNESYTVNFTRTKSLSNPQLPLGGGSVTYSYKIDKTIYVE